MTNLETLKQAGDPLEREIAVSAEIELKCILQPYSDIWVKHVRSRLDPNDTSRVASTWMNFSGRHYSALIRLFNAWDTLQQMKEMSQNSALESEGRALLKWHNLVGSFWWNVSAAADNLQKTVKDADCLKSGMPSLDDKWFTDKAGEYVFIHNAYQNRSQLIHGQVVPVWIDGEMPCTQGYFLTNSAEAEKKTWAETLPQIPKLIDDLHQEQWPGILGDFCAAWNKLKGWLEKYDKAPKPKDVALGIPTPQATVTSLDFPTSGWQQPK